MILYFSKFRKVYQNGTTTAWLFIPNNDVNLISDFLNYVIILSQNESRSVESFTISFCVKI